MKIKFFFLFLFFLNFTESVNARLKYTTEFNNIKISENSLKILKNYFKDEIYSTTYKKVQKNVKGLYFFISESGHGTSVGYCNGLYEDHCDVTLLKSSLLKKCQKLNQEKCYLLAIRKKLVFSDQQFQIKKNPNILEKITVVQNTNNKKYYHYDQMVLNYQDSGADDEWSN